jgi:uncharacterized membrane protein
MADEESQVIDDEPQQRESAVRHAHAVQASRHGRASTPGYLGLPLDEDVPDEVREQSELAEPADPEPDDASRSGADVNPRTRAPRARAKAAPRQARANPSSAGARQKGKQRSRGEGARETTASTRGAKSKTARAGSQSAKSKRNEKSKRTGSTKAAGSARTTQGASKATSHARGKASTSGGRQAQATGAARQRQAGSAAKKASPKKAVRPDRPRRRGAAANATVGSRTLSVVDGLEGDLGKRAARAAAKLTGKVARRAVGVGARAAARAAARGLLKAGAVGSGALIEHTHRLPIQRAIDVGVPIEVAWEQWMEFAYLPEGVHCVSGIERDGDSLSGRLEGPGEREWHAEVLDERENESFAWRSDEGSDSAGLVTFHPLSHSLTRLELNLDVQPTDLAQAAGLALRIADRRVATELRRFKARVELLSPDDYDELLDQSRNGQGPDG